MQVVADLPVGADLAVAPGLGHRDGDGLFMDIKADIQ